MYFRPSLCVEKNLVDVLPLLTDPIIVGELSGKDSEVFRAQDMRQQDKLMGTNQFKGNYLTGGIRLSFDIGNMLVAWSHFTGVGLVFRYEYIDGVMRTSYMFKTCGKCVSVNYYDYP